MHGLSIPAFFRSLFRATANHLANNTVLIIRHSEKPAGGIGLSPAGDARAVAYTTYFAPFRESGLNLAVDSLWAGSDSSNSARPRLTLEPLSHTLHLPIHAEISSKDAAALVHALATQPHGRCPLICWRHKELPSLIAALGASPRKLLPNGRWPTDVFDWVVVLIMDANGKPASARVLPQNISLPSPVKS